MTRPFFHVYGASTVTRSKWRKLRPEERGALLTLWMNGSIRDPECRWSSSAEVVEDLEVDGFPGAAEIVERLVALGWLDCEPDGCTIHDWNDWQPSLPKTEAERKRAQRAREKSSTLSAQVESHDESGHVVTPVTSPDPSPLLSSPVTSSPTRDLTEAKTPPARTRTREVDAVGNPFEDGDPIDDFYLVTGQYPPEGGRLRPWIESVASKGPSRRDFGVVFREEWRANMDVPTALRATEAKLAKMGERARKAEEAEERERANRRILDEPWRRELGAAMYADAKPRNGGMQPLGDLLGSMKRSVPAPAGDSLTVDRRPDAQSAAEPVEANSFAPGKAPGESGPDRVEAPDGRGREEGGSL